MAPWHSSELTPYTDIAARGNSRARGGGEAGIKDSTVADGDVPGGTGAGGNATAGDGEEAVWLRPGRPFRRARARRRASRPGRTGRTWRARWGSPRPRPSADAGLAPRGGAAGRAARPTRPGCPGAGHTAIPGAVALQAASAPAAGRGPRDAPRPRTRPTSTTCRRCRRRCPGWTPPPSSPGSRYSADPSTCSSPPLPGPPLRARRVPRGRRLCRRLRLLVLRMDNGRPPDSGPDDGAVV